MSAMDPARTACDEIERSPCHEWLALGPPPALRYRTALGEGAGSGDVATLEAALVADDADWHGWPSGTYTFSGGVWIDIATGLAVVDPGYTLQASGGAATLKYAFFDGSDTMFNYPGPASGVTMGCTESCYNNLIGIVISGWNMLDGPSGPSSVVRGQVRSQGRPPTRYLVINNQVTYSGSDWVNSFAQVGTGILMPNAVAEAPMPGATPAPGGTTYQNINILVFGYASLAAWRAALGI